MLARKVSKFDSTWVHLSRLLSEETGRCVTITLNEELVALLFRVFGQNATLSVIQVAESTPLHVGLDGNAQVLYFYRARNVAGQPRLLVLLRGNWPNTSTNTYIREVPTNLFTQWLTDDDLHHAAHDAEVASGCCTTGVTPARLTPRSTIIWDTLSMIFFSLRACVCAVSR